MEKYIEKIKDKYNKNPIFFDNMNANNNKYFYLFSFCFFCQNPVVACEDKVICTNGCYKLDVKTEEFNENYSLDKFLDEYNDFCSNHLLCNGDIIPIYVDNDSQSSFFICTKCDQETFKKAEITL